MKRFITNRYTIFALGTIFVFLVWFLISLIIDKNGSIFPSPILTFARLGELLQEANTYRCLLFTMLRMLAGFGLSFLLALVLGAFAGNSTWLYEFLKPLMVTIKSIPTVALVFVFIVIVAPRDAPIFVVMLICFPILYEGVVGGIKNVEKDLVDASKVDGASSFKSLLFVKVPLAIPYIIVAMASSFALSFKIEIMAEVLTGYTRNGLGSVIRAAQAADPNDMTTIFAYALLAVLIMLLVTLLEQVIKHAFKKNKD